MSESRARELVLAGEFKQAADSLDSRKVRSHADYVLRAEIELEIGDTNLALSRVEALLHERLDPKVRAAGLSIAGRALVRLGGIGEGIAHQRKAVALALKSCDGRLESQLQARLVAGLLNWIGIEPALAELPRLRRVALAAGNAPALVDYHITSARIAAMRGWLPRARREARVAFDLLQTSPNKIQLWKLRQIQSNVAIKACDMPAALDHALECLSLAESSGSLLSIGTTLGNLAHIATATGDLERGRHHLDRAIVSLDPASHMLIAAYSTGLEIGLAGADGKFADEMVSKRDQFDEADSKESRYYHLWFELNRVKWLISRNQLSEASERAHVALEAIEKLADTDLLQRMGCLAVECLARTGDVRAASTLFRSIYSQLEDSSLETLAEANRVSALLVPGGASDERRAFLLRAWRILSLSGLRGGREAIRRTLLIAQPDASLDDLDAQVSQPTFDLHSCANLLLLGKQPRALASEVGALLWRSGDCHGVVLEQSVDEYWRLVDSFGSDAQNVEANDGSNVFELELGLNRGDRFRLRVVPNEPDHFSLRWSAIGQLVRAAETAASHREARQQDVTLWPDETPEQQLGMVVVADNMLRLLDKSRRLAPATITVLISGETGTGKELLAHAIHDASPRKNKPFIPFNCSAISREMLDSQLFGYRRGAFTGAQEAFQGVIRAAAGGTLFLDEIGEITLDVQPKLLRFLESSEIHPLGEPRPIIVDVRVVAATNANLEQLVAEGKFRDDLFYRLNVVRIDVPPLRERREEVPPLVQHYLDRYSHEFQKTGLRCAEETMEYLMLYKWPGNVRQLANEVRRLVVLAESGAVLMPEHLTNEIASSRRTVPASERDLAPTEFVVRTDQPLSAAIEHVERTMIQNAVKRAGGMEEAAQLLGLSRKGLYLKRQRLGLTDSTDPVEPPTMAPVRTRKAD